MAEPQFKNVGQLALIILFSVIFSLISLLIFLVEVIRKGPGRVFHVAARDVRPAILSDCQFGSHEFLMLKNSRMKIHCVVNGSQDKPLMLFLHGFPEFWYSWRFQMREFFSQYRVVAIDMRGYGDSDKPTAVSEYHIDKLTDDIRQVIIELGYEKGILVSHDWGGAVAWAFTLRYPQMVDKLVVCNCPHPAAFMEHLQSSWGQMLKSWYMFFFQSPVLPRVILRADDLHKIGAAFCGRTMGAKKGTFSQEDIEAFKYTFAKPSDLVGPINYYKAMMRYKAHTKHDKIACPVLMVWGTNDGALDKRMAELSGKYVENYTLSWVEGASHWVQQEEPVIVNKAIWEFLKKTN